jgi:hypothetical protein
MIDKTAESHTGTITIDTKSELPVVYAAYLLFRELTCSGYHD